jgi:hypothetical protein
LVNRLAGTSGDKARRPTIDWGKGMALVLFCSKTVFITAKGDAIMTIATAARTTAIISF